MLNQIAKIERVQKLYLQLLYRCNQNCLHCFHGKNLQRAERFSLEEIALLLQLFTTDYQTEELVLLGGEPFVYKDLSKVLVLAKDFGLKTAICTNGYRIAKSLGPIAHNIDLLRISVEGLKETNDMIRREKGFDEVLRTLEVAMQLGVRTSATLTVTSANASEIFELAEILASSGVSELKLHQLRLVGNAVQNSHLLCSEADVGMLRGQIKMVQKHIGIRILLDEDLDPDQNLQNDSVPLANELERIEVQPDGGMYVSCKAVGSDSNAFWFDKTKGIITYKPLETDELSVGVPQVRYHSI